MGPVDFNLQVLAKAMTLRLQRHGAIAGNIANADTPGYRPTQVSFEEELQKASTSHNFSKLNGIQSKSEISDDGVARLDGNTVNLDKQMAALSQNAILYNATAEFVARKFRMIKAVLS
jgi:flagellar basal-body rod protein FlgB